MNLSSKGQRSLLGSLRQSGPLRQPPALAAKRMQKRVHLSACLPFLMCCSEVPWSLKNASALSFRSLRLVTMNPTDVNSSPGWNSTF